VNTPTTPRQFFSRFKPEIIRLGETATAVIGVEGNYHLCYVPFESVNAAARIVFVGITPGNTQIAISYRALREALASGVDDASALAHAKWVGAFGGTAMRARLNTMISRFRIHELIGIETPEEIWTESRNIVHATSVVPHAAFKKGKMFNGSFGEVLRVPLLKISFENDFLPTLAALPSSAKFIAIGPMPLEALDWCVQHRYLRTDQLLGAFAHPSGSAGSQVAYFIGRKRPDEFTPGDPVLMRVPWLDRERQRLDEAVSASLGPAPAIPS
jgi:hypothetical protein